MTEQHKLYLRFNNQEARRIVSRFLREADDNDTGEGFDLDGRVWREGMKPEPQAPVEFDPSGNEAFDPSGNEPAVAPAVATKGADNSYYWAMKIMGQNGRLRFPEGHAKAGQLIPGHFAMMAWQGPLEALPARLADNVVTAEQLAAVFPNGPPEVMG